MNYGLIHQQVETFKKGIMTIIQSLHLQLSGESIRAKAIEQILIDKKIMTEDDLKKNMAAVITELNASNKTETEKPKKELAKPTSEEVAKVEESKKTELPKK